MTDTGATPMTANEMRTRVLELIKGWMQNDRVKADETAMLVLNDLAGDVEIIDTGA